MKAVVSQLLAAAQLAEMAYNADTANHKKEAWEKAQTEYEQAAADERAEWPAEPEPPKSELEIMEAIINELDHKYQELDAKNQALENDKAEILEKSRSLYKENVLLNSQLNEKNQKIDELEKSLLYAKSTAPEPAAPVATPPVKPLTGAAKVAAEAKAAKAAVNAVTDETKKNS